MLSCSANTWDRTAGQLRDAGTAGCLAYSRPAGGGGDDGGGEIAAEPAGAGVATAGGSTSDSSGAGASNQGGAREEGGSTGGSGRGSSRAADGRGCDGGADAASGPGAELCELLLQTGLGARHQHATGVVVGDAGSAQDVLMAAFVVGGWVMRAQTGSCMHAAAP